jgi:hypothetical protein
MWLNSGVTKIQRAGSRTGMRWLVFAGMTCLLASSACSSHQSPPPSTDVVDLNSDGQGTGKTMVRVDNQNLTDMTIYVYQSTHRIRLGRARGNSVTNLMIPSSIVSGVTQLRFYAEPMGNSRGAISDPIPVSPGDQVDFLIP